MPWTLVTNIAGGAGPTGNTGAQGPTGNAGPQGPVGATGVRASNCYSGTTVPGTITGQLPNDLYLNSTNGDVYQYT